MHDLLLTLGLNPFGIVFHFPSSGRVLNHNKVCFGNVFVLWSEEMLTVTFPTNCNSATA